MDRLLGVAAALGPTLNRLIVIASEAKQSKGLDCFVANAPRNDDYEQVVARP
jgi:hypothetical protein